MSEDEQYNHDDIMVAVAVTTQLSKDNRKMSIGMFAVAMSIFTIIWGFLYTTLAEYEAETLKTFKTVQESVQQIQLEIRDQHIEVLQEVDSEFERHEDRLHKNGQVRLNSISRQE